MRIELTREQLTVLRDTLKWGIIGNYDTLGVETDEETRAALKQEMRAQAGVLKCLGVGRSALRKFFIKWRHHDGKKGLKNFTIYLEGE